MKVVDASELLECNIDRSSECGSSFTFLLSHSLKKSCANLQKGCWRISKRVAPQETDQNDLDKSLDSKFKMVNETDRRLEINEIEFNRNPWSPPKLPCKL